MMPLSYTGDTDTLEFEVMPGRNDLPPRYVWLCAAICMALPGVAAKHGFPFMNDSHRKKYPAIQPAGNIRIGSIHITEVL